VVVVLLRVHVVDRQGLLQETVGLGQEDGGEVAILDEPRQADVPLGGSRVCQLGAKHLATLGMVGHLAGQEFLGLEGAALLGQRVQAVARPLHRHLRQQFVHPALARGDDDAAPHPQGVMAQLVTMALDLVRDGAEHERLPVPQGTEQAVQTK